MEVIRLSSNADNAWSAAGGQPDKLPLYVDTGSKKIACFVADIYDSFDGFQKAASFAANGAVAQQIIGRDAGYIITPAVEFSSSPPFVVTHGRWEGPGVVWLNICARFSEKTWRWVQQEGRAELERHGVKSRYSLAYDGPTPKIYSWDLSEYSEKPIDDSWLKEFCST